MNKAILLFAILSAAAGAVIPALFPTKAELQMADIEYIGMADGKSFFKYIGQPLNWTEANSTCSSMNMRLASINSTAQVAFLTNPLNDSHYWTSGRDALIHRQFSWDTTGQVVLSGLANLGVHTVPQTCLAFGGSDGNKFHTHYCTETFRAVCEIS